jgi:hypothetical protein
MLVMTLLVRDEEDILRQNIEFHLAQGVDYFIATDNASHDRTTEILKEYRNNNVLTYIREEDTEFSQSKWVTRMAKMAYEEFGAHWVINNDADEFWWPHKGNLKSSLEEVKNNFNIVRVQRHNMLLTDTSLQEEFHHMIFRKKKSLNFLGDPLPSKVCHRGSSDITVMPGSHEVSSRHAGLEICGNMIIYHYPLRNIDQFIRKISNIGSGYAVNPQIDPKSGQRPGIVNRTLHDNYKKNKNSMYDFVKTKVKSYEYIRSGLNSGDIVEDRTIFDFISNL